VIANGDIVDAETARTALARSGADGVMIGRGAQGRPWILAQVASELFGTSAPRIPKGRALVDMVAGHYSDMLSFYGTELGLKVARKHLGWYMDAANTNATVRRGILTARTPQEVLERLDEALLAPVAELGDAG
jgi:tRNA-dihydrouridine synthase